ncbi:hypothetical protein PG987_006287 [Apiospora arundinis]
MSFEEWTARTATVSWGKPLRPDGKVFTDRERYWYFYAMTKVGAGVVRLMINDRFKASSRQGCIFINLQTDRFMISEWTSSRDKAHAPRPWAPQSLQPYEINRRHVSLILTKELTVKMQNIVYCDVYDDDKDAERVPDYFDYPLGNTLTREPTCKDLQSLAKPEFFLLQYDEAKTCTARLF